jgi:DNA-binding SARP family transcriptional activator/WD40 repeat protein
VLGSLEVEGHDGSLEVGGPKERAALAVLAAHVDEVVSGELLIDALWGDQPPRSAAKLVQNLVLRLRKALGRDLIETRPGGYVLRVEPDAVDARRFERLVAEGRTLASRNEMPAALAALTEAVGLWRGRPLGELADWPPVQPQVTQLEELHRCAEEELAEAALAVAHHREWVPRLEALVTEEPLRERRWGLLMVALYRSGRQTDALRAYQRARAALGELGLEPGPELRLVERAVAAQESALTWPTSDQTQLPATPTGVVTFLLTDVARSSQLWERSPEGMAAALERYDAMIADAVIAAGGTMLKTRGDGESRISVFARVSAAVAGAVAARDALAAEPWPDAAELGVRMAIHIGEAHERDGDYRGPTVDRAARLRELGSGDEVLVSEAVATLIRDELPAGWDLAELGEHALRGLTRPERVFALVPSGATLGRDATVVARSCPYMGLLPFGTDDDRLFFGRDDVVATLLERVARDRFVVVVGASGSGKSSLLRAGFVARLGKDGASETHAWLPVVCTPTARPLAELAARVAPLCGHRATELARDLVHDARALDVALREALASRAEQTRVALVIDQLEQLFTLCDDELERQQYLDALLDAASTPDARTAVVVALRADFFGHASTHKGLAAMLEARSLVLGAMSEEGLRAAIEAPAAVAGLSLEAGLADLVLRDVTGEPGGLPLLSHALVEVWARREGSTLTVNGYRASGGVSAAIARTAEAVYTRLDADGQLAVRGIFVRLTELGEGTEHTARRATIDELLPDDDAHAARTQSALDVLAAARLITMSAGRVEVAHEALIREWPRLRGWLDEDRDGLRLMHHLAMAASEWDHRGRDDSDLYRGPRLAAAVEWHNDHDAAANPLEREFLEASCRLQDSEIREISAGNRRLRWVLSGTAVALVLALLAGTTALRQRDQASSARDRASAAVHAETVERLVAQSRLAQSTSLDLALLLAVEANRRSDTPATRGALQSALVSNPQLLGFLHGDAPYVSVSIAESGIIAAGTDQGTVDLWDAAARRRLETLAVGSGAVVARFDPAGTSLAAVSGRSLALWDPATGRRVGGPLTTEASDAYGTPFAFSPDGAALSSALASGEVATWDVGTRAENGARLVSDVGGYRAAAYSPDGGLLAVGGATGEVTLYDTATRQPVGPSLEAGPTASVGSLAFDRHGTRLAAATSSGASFAWDLTTGQRIPLPGGPAPDVLGQDGAEGEPAFSPYEDTLATGYNNGLHLVDLAQPEMPPLSVPTQGGVVRGVAYSPDGTWIATANTSGTIALVDVAGRRKLGEPVATPYLPIRFSPDGELFASPDYSDGSVILGTLDGRREVRRLSPPGMQPIPAGGAWPQPAFDADGTRLAYGGVTGHVTIFDVASGAVIQTLPTPPATSEQPIFPAPESYVGRLAFSPDGTKLVVASLETGTIFDLRTGRELGHPTGWGITAMGATFTPDGTLVVISGLDGATLTFDPDTGDQVGEPIADAQLTVNGPDGMLATTDHAGTIRLVEVATRQRVGPEIVGPRGIVLTMDVLPSGTELVASYGFAQIAQLFDIRTGHPIGDPFPSKGAFGFATVTPDGSTLVTGDGQRVVAWDLDQTAWPAIACQVAGRNLTGAEWARYLPNAGPRRATCPDHPT